jgi:hypothetical protein
MRHATAVSVRRRSIPRAWTILGFALASWAVVIVGSQVAGALFNYILSNV